MTHYLIEFRFHGKAKYEIKKIIHGINRKFRLGYKRPIPHLTLVGPFYTNDEKRLINDFNGLCYKSPLMNFEIDGFSTFENSKVVFLDVKPSKELVEFRWNLSQTLKPYCQLKSFDYEKDFAFHTTIAMKLPDDKFFAIKDYIQKKPKLNFKHVLVRATLIKGGLILREYDFLLQRSLVRGLAKNKMVYSKTLNLLNDYFANRLKPDRFKEHKINTKSPSILEKVIRLFRKSKTFVSSDLHLDHTNIIKYCNRPFQSTEEMNKTLVNNWNNLISYQDKVYFLGDMSFGTNKELSIPSRPADYWLRKLKGKIYFTRGFSINANGERNQHDKIIRAKNVFDSLVIEYKGIKFFLVHDPAQIPFDWDGWAICGHNHNNKLDEYPLINKKNKRINASVELTNYMPLDMEEITSMIKN